LNEKETYINNFINNPQSFSKLQTIANNTKAGLEIIKDLTTDKRIWVILIITTGSTLVGGEDFAGKPFGL
jgi:hypothetical protein